MNRIQIYPDPLQKKKYVRRPKPKDPTKFHRIKNIAGWFKIKVVNNYISRGSSIRDNY